MARFVEFTNARANKPVWVNPDHVRNAQAVPGHDDWTDGKGSRAIQPKLVGSNG
jgi:hypothetical protein